MTFKRQQRLQRITFVLLVAAIAVLAWQVNTNRGLARDGRQAKEAICTLKADLRQRLTDGEKFLREHPDGLAGIPASVIQNSIKGQRATLKALRLPCPTDPA